MPDRTRSGQQGNRPSGLDLDALIAHFIDTFPGAIRSNNGLPEILRWLLPTDHPALSGGSLKQLQLIDFDEPLPTEVLDRWARWLVKRMGADAANIDSALSDALIADIDGSRVRRLVRFLRQVPLDLREPRQQHLAALVVWVDARLEQHETAGSGRSVDIDWHVQNTLFVMCLAGSVAAYLMVDGPGVVAFGARWWPESVADGTALRPSRHVFVHTLLSAHARRAGEPEPKRRSAQVRAIVAAIAPDDPKGGAPTRVERGIARLLGPPTPGCDHRNPHTRTGVSSAPTGLLGYRCA